MKATELARILSEELERDQWGSIDPYLFEELASGEPDPDSDNYEEVIALREVLERVVARAFPKRPPR
jgi:hypothetical protein